MFIVHLICSFTTGGAETMLVDIINEQIRVRHHVALVVINNLVDESLLALLDKKVRIYRINRVPGSRTLGSLVRLNYLLYKLGADILHCHDCVIAGMLFPVFRQKLCLTIHLENVSDKYLPVYKKLIAVSDAVKSDVETRTSLHVDLICNGVVTDKILRKSDWWIEGPFRIVVVSRLEHLVKGQHIMLEALRLLVYENKKNIKLDFIGEGSSRNYLKALVDSYQLNDCVNFLGIKNREYIYDHLSQYDLLVQPSIHEGFGLTVVEAMIANLPVLVSGNGPVEIVSKGKYGYCFNSGDINDCVEKIAWIIDNYLNCKIITGDAVQYAEDRFSICNTVYSYIQLYDSMISHTI